MTDTVPNTISVLWRWLVWSLTWGWLALDARADDLKVLSAGAFKPVLVAVQNDFESQSGHRLLISNDTAGGLQRRVLAGEGFDLVVSSPASLAAMRAAGKLADAEPTGLARVSIGVAVAPGTAWPDISSVTAFQGALRAARRIAYIDPAAGGSSGIYLDGLFERWSLRDEIRAKAILVPGGLVAARVMDGSADLALHQISEIKAVPGAVLVGPIPAEIQHHTVYAAAVPVKGASVAAQALLAYLQAPHMAALWRDKGMEPMEPTGATLRH